MKFLCMIITFILEVVKYHLAVYIFYNEKCSKLKVSVIAIIVYATLILCSGFNVLELYLIMYGIVLITIYLELNGKIRQKLHDLFLIALVLICIDEIMGTLTDIFLANYSIQNILYFDYLAECTFSLFVFLMILLVKHQNFSNFDKHSDSSARPNNFTVLGIALFLSIAIRLLNSTKNYISNDKYRLVIACVSIFAFLIVIILTTSMIYLKNLNEKMKNMYEMEHTFINIQREHYQMLLEREANTKQFRHDVNDHLLCIRELLDKQKYKETSNYIEKLQINLNKITNKSYFTGNDVLDSILNYYLPVLNQDVEITVTGKCNHVLFIDDIDFCTIISNLIKNAVNEISVQIHGDKYMKVIIKQRKEYLKIEICNSLANKEELVTEGEASKEQTGEHGFGLKIVRETINEIHGILRLSKQSNEFKAIVILKNPILN